MTTVLFAILVAGEHFIPEECFVDPTGSVRAEGAKLVDILVHTRGIRADRAQARLRPE